MKRMKSNLSSSSISPSSSLFPDQLCSSIVQQLHHIRNEVDKSGLSPKYIRQFLQSQLDDIFPEDELNENSESIKKREVLESIAEELRNKLPITAQAPNEKFYFHEQDDFEGYHPENTLHVDAFLYPEDILDDYCEKGLISRSFCHDCGSKNVLPFNFISHSASMEQLEMIFHLLGDMKNKLVVDLGSRTGVVLYAGFLLSDAKKLIGIEKSEYFCKLQKEVIKQYEMENRVEILCNDILNEGDLISKADVIIMHNVFEFFASQDEIKKLWQFVRDSVKRPGTVLISMPSIASSLEKAQISLDVDNWVTEVPLDFSGFGTNEEQLEDFEQIHMYHVK